MANTNLRMIGIALWMAVVACRGNVPDSHETARSVETPAAAERVALPDPCLLVSTGDMAVMFGELKEGPLPSSGLRGERQCNYTNMQGSWIKLSLAFGRDRWAEDRGLFAAQMSRDLGGLGDEAYLVRRGTDAVVNARKGETLLELTCSCPDARAEAIARVAVQKL
jgi:hypothetical protein